MEFSDKHQLKRSFYLCAAAAFLSACGTTGRQTPSPIVIAPPPVETGEANLPDSAEPPTVPATPSGPVAAPPDPDPPIEDMIETVSAFDELTFWSASDTRPALRAFQKSCALWARRDPERYLNANLPDYGRYRDWEGPCFLSDYVADDAASARAFFENNFQPVSVSTRESDKGLLTGYYEPEVTVRRRPDAIFSEPILSLPTDPAVQALARKDISVASATPIAFGKPIDVFFMQIQGSGRIKFEDGEIVRAAFAGHNNRPYRSIGSELIRRGVLTRDTASKQSIEAWMNKNSRQDVRALMNSNPRYVFFQAEALSGDEGPKGAMGIALEAMGTMAVDPRYHPYGTLAWLDTTLPQTPGDYTGAQTGILVSAQDTGAAIKGALRGDLFFGSGDRAGQMAGVMKHDVRWTVLLPVSLAYKFAAVF